MKNPFILAAFVCGIGAIAAVIVFSHTDQTNYLTIGGAFALSGSAPEWGQDEVQAAQIAIDEVNAAGGINGTLVRMIVEDTRTDSTGTLTAVQKLITIDHVPVIIGPTWGDSFGAVVGPLGEQYHVVQITPSGSIEVAESTIDYPHFFSTFFPQAPEIARHMRYLHAHNYTRVALIFDQDPFNTAVSRLYEKEAAARGVQTAEFQAPLGTKDFRTIVTRVKDFDPDVVFVAIFEVGESGTILKTMQELGMTAPIAGTASILTSNLITSYGDYTEEKVIATAPDTSSDRAQTFLRKFETAYGHGPRGASAANAYDAARLVLAALQNGARTGDEIKAFFETVRMPGTVVDTLSFTMKGQIADTPFVLKTVRNGMFVELKE